MGMPQHGDFRSPQQPSTAGAPMVLDIGKRAGRHAVAGGSVAGGMGILITYAALNGNVSGGHTAQVLAWVIGLFLLGMGLLAVLLWKPISRDRKLIVDANGITWHDPRGAPWAVGWPELAGVSISRTKQRRVWASRTLRLSVLVRLDLFPADPSFRQRHQGMEHLWERHKVRNGYRLPLGDAPDYVPILDDAMRRFCPAIYGGIRDEGFVVGLR
ncbi:hypothetical protein [Parasphingorhabdus pacifica]